MANENEKNLEGNFQIQGNLPYKAGVERIGNRFNFFEFLLGQTASAEETGLGCKCSQMLLRRATFKRSSTIFIS